MRPLVEVEKSEWRKIDATEEFPSQGQIFWPNAQSAAKGALITFRAESNPGQKDEFKVVDPKPAFEVLDLRDVGGAIEVRTALAAGVRLPGPTGPVRALIWCKDDVLVGPIELMRVVTGIVRLTGTNLARVPSFTGAQVRSVASDRYQRLLRVDDGAPSGYVDWDDDATVLRRALETAVRVAKQAGRDPGQTKRQIEEAAKALAAQGIGLDAQLDRYRLERALALCGDSDVVARHAPEFAELLREHPAVKAMLDAVTATVRTDIEQTARADLDERLAREHAALKEATAAHARMRSQVEATERDLRNAEEKLTELRSQAASAASEVEAAVDARVLAAMDRPLDLLAEVSVLRPLLATRDIRRGDVPATEVPARIDWSSPRGESIKDRVALQRALTNSARARGVDPSLMLRVHAAVAARLMPVALGPAALAALAAYADAACGSRLLVLHMSPGFILPRDLYEAPGGGLLAAAAAARGLDGISMLVLEGANRSPLEASVVPILQLNDVGLSPIAASPGLRIASTLVAGATTVPVSSQLWSHATAIYPEPTSASSQPTSAPGDMSLSSELLTPGDVPIAEVDELVETWPDCREIRPALERLGAALSRFYEGPRIAEALLHGVLLPYLVTSLGAEKQDDLLTKVGDGDASLAAAARRLRRRLC